jgi:asparagine synthase (glutamine-hydrolysing)
MCGIVGLVREDSHSRDDSPLTRMRDTLACRGPDDADTWWSADQRVGLAHRRLSVIDLSAAGRQPMQDTGGQLCITFNGEIYNYRELRADLQQRGHRFRTATDTEVVLAAYRAWGVDCVQRLNGMFSFALYDEAQQHLLLARDRAGEKPLFYAHGQGELRFASELKALMADPAFPRVISPEALSAYLAFGYVSGDACMLQGVKKLLPAHALLYDLKSGAARTWAYWELPEWDGVERAAPDLLDEFEELLTDAVSRQMVADVPVGVLLSGGVDSSLVTALASRTAPERVTTFTIIFPGHGVYDEGPHARIVAKHFGTRHLELVAEPASVELMPQLARQFDEPLADSSIVPTFLVSRLVRQHATVALGGDGGDELFGGYLHYSRLLRQERLRRIIPRPARRVAGVLARQLPVGLPGRNYVVGLSHDRERAIVHATSYFDARLRHELLAPALRAGIGFGDPEAHRVALARRSGSLLQAATALDFSTYLPDDILVKVDRASMLTSLEVRAPFLDHRVVELAFGRVPDHLRTTRQARKILPRMLAERLLPPELDTSRKRGFSVPLGAWFRSGWGDYMADVLGGAPQELFDRKTIAALLAGQRRGYSNTERLFSLTMFELWRRAYDVALPS